jgi:hypothetical protein
MNRYLLVLFLGLGLGWTLSAQTFISGIFQETDQELEYLEALPWEQFLQEKQRLNAAGYRLYDLETAGVGEDRAFWGIFTKSSARDTVAMVLGWENFIKYKRDLASRNYLLTDVSGFAIDETESYFIGVWVQERQTHKVYKLDSKEKLLAHTDAMAKQNFFIKSVKVISTPAGNPTFVALYHYHAMPQRNYIFVSDSKETFNEEWLQRDYSGMRLIDFDQFEENGVTYLLGVYQRGKYEHQLVRDLERNIFVDRWDRLEAQQELQLTNWHIRS